MRKRFSKTLRKYNNYSSSVSKSEMREKKTVRKRGKNIKTKHFFAERNIA